MKEELRILMIEDVPSDAELEIRELKRAGLRVAHRLVETEEAFREALRESQPDIILSDFSMPHFDGMWALALARELVPDVPFLFVSGTIGEEYAIRALKNGATDYVLKNNLVRLPAAVERALEECAERAVRRKVERELGETRSRLESIIASIPDVVWSVSLDPYRLLYVSPGFGAAWGAILERMWRDPEAWLDMVHPDDKAHVEAAWRRTTQGEPLDSVYRIVRSDGEVLWINNRGQAVRDADGRFVRIDGVARDVTRLKQQEERISRLSRIHAVLSGINSLIVRAADREQLFREACRIIVEQGGLVAAWIGTLDPGREYARMRYWFGRDMDWLAHARFPVREDAPRGESIVGLAMRTRQAIVVNDIRQDPRVVFASELLARGFLAAATLPLEIGKELAGVLVFYSGERGFFDDQQERLLRELAGDISFALDHIEKSRRIDYLAYYDGLTGLPNRHLFREQMDQLVQTARLSGARLALLALDLRRFTSVNASLGRHGGDLLLKAVAERLKLGLGDSGLIARITGNVFVLALREVQNEADIAHFMEHCYVECLDRPFELLGEQVRLSARIGIAMHPGDGRDSEELLKNAEAALKNAKQRSERYLFYSPEMNARVAGQLKLENDLRDALPKEQFVLYYQPRFDLASGVIVGLEGLIRWIHPERGMVSPGEFIPLLEETGMIAEVGGWALKRAALDHAAWCAAGLKPPRIAVNVSQVQLRGKDFVDYVKDALAGVEKAAERIDIEITESMLMEDIEGTIGKLQALRSMGLHIAVDDFGTGYSSLSYLARLPIDSLKIDRSFVVQMNKGPEQMAIVSTVISLGRALNLKVVAEGVETEEQANLLRLLRCDEAQGYLYARPASAEETEKLLQSA